MANVAPLACFQSLLLPALAIEITFYTEVGPLKAKASYHGISADHMAERMGEVSIQEVQSHEAVKVNTV